MNTMVKQFEVMDEVMLSNIEGGVSCFEGIVGIGGLGAVAGPWGVLGGVLVGVAIFCM